VRTTVTFGLGLLIATLCGGLYSDCLRRRAVFDDLVARGCRPITPIVDGYPERCRLTCVTPDGQVYQTNTN
jgi:hypothetical protein